MLGRIRKNINIYTAGTIYGSFVLPILDYCDKIVIMIEIFYEGFQCTLKD